MGLLGEATYALIRGSTSAIGNLIPDITIEEQHRDEVAITRHPVEGGAVITDHAYALPAELEIKCGYSNSTGGSEGYVQQQYAAFRALQLARKPFTVYTDKRKYQNMLIRGLSTVTDEKNKNILVANVALQQVLIVSTQTTSSTGSNTTSASGDNTNQSNPASTGSVANSGNVEAQGVGSQAFAGAYNSSASNPGTGFDPNAGSAPVGIGSTSFGDVGSTLSGLSASAEINTGVATFADGTTGQSLATGPSLSVFGKK